MNAFHQGVFNPPKSSGMIESFFGPGEPVVFLTWGHRFRWLPTPSSWWVAGVCEGTAGREGLDLPTGGGADSAVRAPGRARPDPRED